MLKGTFFGIAACFIWGLIFVIPGYIEGFSPIEIALGRHFVNGVTSCLVLLVFSGMNFRKFSFSVWKTAFLFSLIVNVGFYCCLVLSVTHASPAIAALIIGISPIVIAFYGNWVEKESRIKQLIIPSILIFCGLLLLNMPLILGGGVIEDRPFYAFGVLSACACLVAWSWYVVANARFLKKNPQVCPQEWAGLLGVTTLIWVIGLGIAYEAWYDHEHWGKFIVPSSELWSFVIGCLILGVLCSWVGTFLWNKACSLLPVSYVGQLTIFEALFGLLFFYLPKQEFPSYAESIGAGFMLLAIVYAMRQVSMQPGL